MKNVKPKVGDIIHITFWDHAESSDDALLFEVMGRLYKITKMAYCLKSWCYASDLDKARDSHEDNETKFAIVKRAIDSIKVIK